MNIPAAMARIARITLRPPRPRSWTIPQAMRKMANNRKPIFFVNFILIILSFYDYGKVWSSLALVTISVENEL
jgi:hypothetical protein